MKLYGAIIYLYSTYRKFSDYNIIVYFVIYILFLKLIAATWTQPPDVAVNVCIQPDENRFSTIETIILRPYVISTHVGSCRSFLLLKTWKPVFIKLNANEATSGDCVHVNSTDFNNIMPYLLQCIIKSVILVTITIYDIYTYNYIWWPNIVIG